MAGIPHRSNMPIPPVNAANCLHDNTIRILNVRNLDQLQRRSHLNHAHRATSGLIDPGWAAQICGESASGHACLTRRARLRPIPRQRCFQDSRSKRSSAFARRNRCRLPQSSASSTAPVFPPPALSRSSSCSSTPISGAAAAGRSVSSIAGPYLGTAVRQGAKAVWPRGNSAARSGQWRRMTLAMLFCCTQSIPSGE